MVHPSAKLRPQPKALVRRAADVDDVSQTGQVKRRRLHEGDYAAIWASLYAQASSDVQFGSLTTARLAEPNGQSRQPHEGEHVSLPVETWQQILSHLGKKDLLNLAVTSKYIGSISCRQLYARASLGNETLIPWTRGVTRTHFARTIKVSFTGISSEARLAQLIYRLSGALSHLSFLEDLILTDVSTLPTFATHDILKGAPETLKTFHCDSDALVRASWHSLTKQKRLTDLRILFDHTYSLASDISPDIFPHLQVLDAGAPFVSRATSRSTFTRLSIHVARANAQQVVQRIMSVLGHQIRALRVVRSILVPGTGGVDFSSCPLLQADILASANRRFWESDSPLVLCSVIRSECLQLLEVRDKSACTKPSFDVERLRHDDAYQDMFAPHAQALRTPHLTTLIWLPVWAKLSWKVSTILLDHAKDLMTMLPIRVLALPPIQRMAAMQAHGALEPEFEPWTLWHREEYTTWDNRPPQQYIAYLSADNWAARSAG